MAFATKNESDENDSEDHGVRGRSPVGKPNPIDVHVGHRLRLRRTLLGMSQQKVGEALGLTFQQVQKYERGANRIGASRLWDLSGVLDCPISFFFDEMHDEGAPDAYGRTKPEQHDAESREEDPMNRRETLELVRAYYRINGDQVRKRIYELTKSLAGPEKPAEELPQASDQIGADRPQTGPMRKH
ncbi:MAG: helix-turn-helix domain-containing protein [Rhodospirillaceae bacterium]